MSKKSNIITIPLAFVWFCGTINSVSTILPHFPSFPRPPRAEESSPPDSSESGIPQFETMLQMTKKLTYTPQSEHFYRIPSIIAPMILCLTLATTCITTTTTLHAQPVGVTGYEAITLESSAFRLDEFGRVHGDTVEYKPDLAVWVNGEVIVLPTPEGYTSSYWGGISPTTGIIVGGLYNLWGPTPPIVWTLQDYSYTLLPMLPGSGSSTTCDGRDINDAGWMAGACQQPYMVGLWINKNDPINLGSEAPQVGRINEHNEMIVSEVYHDRIYLLRPRPTDPLSWDWIDLLPPDEEGNVRGLNNNAEVVGEHSSRASYYWYDGIRTILPEPYPCGNMYVAMAINDSGLIAGAGVRSDCTGSAMIWERVTPLGINPPIFKTHAVRDYMPRQPGIKIEVGRDINSAGQIAAWGELENGEDASFLVTPYLLNMSDPVPGKAGQVNTATVTNLTPGQQVHIVWGTLPGAQPIGGNYDCLGGLVLIRDAITNPSLTAVADDTGTAIVDIFVPLQTAGKLVRYQAVAPDECNISHTVEFTFE